MTRKRREAQGVVDMTPERIAREDAIEALYSDNPSLRALNERGQIDQGAYEQARRLRDAGPAERPFTALIAALRAERERQALSLADIAERTGMDRAAIHKLEIGLNKNPTYATLSRYADALGMHVSWALKPKEQTNTISCRGQVRSASDQVQVGLTARTKASKGATKSRSRSRKAEEGTKTSTDPAGVS
jgi:transcriptional regulator with XRE-family HTH domain